MSETSRARGRERITGERYTTALMHVRDQCGRCRVGKRCDACVKEPCLSCRPVCPGRVSEMRRDTRPDAPPLKCQFDDLQPSGRRACTYCRNVW